MHPIVKPVEEKDAMIKNIEKKNLDISLTKILAQKTIIVIEFR